MKRLLLSTIATIALTSQSWAAPDVVVTIKPLHSIVASVMDGVGEPKLIVEGSSSPHNFTLRPSQAKNIQDADLIVWIGENLETPLVKALEAIPQNTKVMEVGELAGLTTHKFREGGHDHGEHEGHDDHAGHDDHKDEEEHAGHDHDEHKHEEEGHKHDDHDHDHKEETAEKHDDHDHGHKEEAAHKHDDHGHDEDKHEEHAGDGHEGHNHAAGGVDPHLWLDIDNMKVVAGKIADTLKEMDPENAAKYEANAKKLKESLGGLETEVASLTAPAKSLEYVVFHDAYQYFEKQFGLKEPIAITLNPEIAPGAARIKEIKEEVEEHSISCLFSEPQFSPKVLEVVAENTQKEIAVIDPLGSAIDAGKDHYAQTILQMANSFKGCVKS